MSSFPSTSAIGAQLFPGSSNAALAIGLNAAGSGSIKYSFVLPPEACRPVHHRVRQECDRLIGEQPPGATRIAFAAQQRYQADSPLLPSGLLGPVKVVSLSK